MKRIPYIKDFDKWKAGFDYSVDIRVRFCETDANGHVSNITAFIYYEEARTEYFRQLNFPEEDRFMVANLQSDYINEIYFDEEIKIYIKTDSVGTSSADIHYLGVKSDGTICLTGRSTIVLFDMQAKKSRALSEMHKAKLLNQYDYVE